jgi:hypothetical protein
MRVVASALVVSSLVGVSSAQSPAPATFEVASVKPNSTGDQHESIQLSSGRVVATNMQLRELILPDHRWPRLD